MRRLLILVSLLLAADLRAAEPDLAAKLAGVTFDHFAEAPGYSEGPTWRKGELFFCSGALLKVDGVRRGVGWPGNENGGTGGRRGIGRGYRVGFVGSGLARTVSGRLNVESVHRAGRLDIGLELRVVPRGDLAFQFVVPGYVLGGFRSLGFQLVVYERVGHPLLVERLSGNRGEREPGRVHVVGNFHVCSPTRGHRIIL